LHQARSAENAQLAVAASDGQSHPVIGLWSVDLREQLRHALVVEGVRGVGRWTERYRLATVEWPVETLDPFFNANTTDDLAAADCPFLPRDLVARLHHARAAENAELAVAASDGQSHPVIGLWSVALREQLRHALVVEDVRRIDRWTARYRLATVEWPVDTLDPFFNANTMDDIAAAEQLAALDGG
jgi:molybdopterin-guanine dinucleotide biosynthesis protein A